MKKIFGLIILLHISMVSGQFVWEEPVWVNQGAEIHNMDDGWHVQTVLCSDGIYLVWTESMMSSLQLFVHKYTLEGESLWTAPESYDVSEQYIYLCSAVADGSDDLIISFMQLNDSHPVRLIKIDGNGELLWQSEFIEQDSYVSDIELKGCDSEAFYLHYFYTDLQGDYYNYFYRLDADGNISDNWNLPDTSDFLELEDWIIDSSGYMSILYVGNDAKLKLQKYNLAGEEVFEAPIIICDYFGVWSEYPASLQLMNDGSYLCSSVVSTLLIDQSGEIVWQMDQYDEFGYVAISLIAGEDCFYEISCFNELYQFSYDQEENWNLLLMPEEGEVINAYLRGDDGIRLIVRETAEGIRCYDYRLLDYDNDGELLSPENGWLNLLEYSSRYYPVFDSDFMGNTVWTGLKFDENLQQELSFVTVAEDGEIITGSEQTVVRTGIEQNLKPVEIDVTTEHEAILMEDTSFTTTGTYNNRLIYQKLDADGLPFEDPSGEIISSGRNQILSRRDDQVLFSCVTDEAAIINIVDMDTGELLWGEDGYEINANEVSCITGDIVNNTAIIFWKDNGVFWVEGILAGVSFWGPHIVPIIAPGNTQDQIALKGQFIINRSTSYYQITHLSDQGDIQWSFYYLAPRYSHDDVFFEVIDGLIFLTEEFINGYIEVHCQKVSHLGNPMFGANGFDIEYEEPYTIGGFIRLENGYGLYCYDEEEELPVKLMIFDDNGEIILPFCELEGTENRELAAIEGVPDGFVLMLTEPSEMYYDLYCARYDLTGALINTGYENPLLCYEEFAHNNAIAIDLHENNLFFTWESMLNSKHTHVSNAGNNVLMQGIEFTITPNEDNEVYSDIIALNCYPNPFNPEITIHWSFTELNSSAEIKIFNIKGQIVKKHQIFSKNGNYVWDGASGNGEKCASGIYLVRAQNGYENSIKRVLLLK